MKTSDKNRNQTLTKIANAFKTIFEIFHLSKKELLLTPVLFIILVLSLRLLVNLLSIASVRSSDDLYFLDNKYVLGASEANGGATTDFNTGIGVTNNNIWDRHDFFMGLTNGGAVLLQFNGTLEDVKYTWIDNRTIKISCGRFSEIYAKRDSWKDIKVVFDDSCNYK